MAMALNRRQVMSLAATMLLGGLIGRDKSFDHDRLALRLDDLQRLGQMDNLRLLGRLCVDLVPQDRRQLFEAAGIDASKGAQEQFAGFAHKRQEDFLLGRTRIVSGWVLAEAECALCVLCAQV
jgi:hypothetical protein